MLVDTGYGLRDVAHPHRRPDPRITLPWRAMLNIRLHERETAIRQVEALGYRADDVRHIVATHLDFDHAGGLEDFPNATIHVMAREYDDATGPLAGIVVRNRWRPRQFDAVRHWRGYGASGEAWFGFDAVRDLEGLPPEILMVPLPGHTWGHAGVAVRENDGRWCCVLGTPIFTRARCGRRGGALRRGACVSALDGGGCDGAAACAVDRAARSGRAGTLSGGPAGRR
ncbi:MBL fold metallo-hydrolase [Sphingomonadaceae bacterium OTU29MARTA1]|nr:MBL fold metallo-hydrolase [Sphingomonadaceae bacterium OTU29MARTA1]